MLTATMKHVYILFIVSYVEMALIFFKFIYLFFFLLFWCIFLRYVYINIPFPIIQLPEYLISTVLFTRRKYQTQTYKEKGSSSLLNSSSIVTLTTPPLILPPSLGVSTHQFTHQSFHFSASQCSHPVPLVVLSLVFLWESELPVIILDILSLFLCVKILVHTYMETFVL